MIAVTNLLGGKYQARNGFNSSTGKPEFEKTFVDSVRPYFYVHLVPAPRVGKIGHLSRTLCGF